MLLSESPKIEALNADNIAIMRDIPNKAFDLAIVDPPYGINAANMTMGSNPSRSGRDKRGEIQYGSVSVAQKLKKGRLNQGAGYFKDKNLTKMNCNWDFKRPTKEYWRQLFRISKNQIIWGYNYFTLPASRGVICWDKKQPWDNFSQFELAWTSFDRPARMISLSNRGGQNDEDKIHPTQKPTLLYMYLLEHYANAGDKIIDTHAGSLSIGLACYVKGFSLLAIEKDEAYYEASVKRFKEATYQQVNEETKQCLLDF